MVSVEGIVPVEPVIFYVMPDDFKKLRAVEEDEILTLAETATKTTSYSRLGCQIELKKKYDNITVTIAAD